LGLTRAAQLLDALDEAAPGVRIGRARLELYRGNCAAAADLLDDPGLPESPLVRELRSATRGCNLVMASAPITEDREAGLWVRTQDDEDRVLMADIVATAAASRRVLQEALGIDWPDPIRVEVVRDRFSLSTISGLPVEAAETTGTVGIARFGRVMLVSPRASKQGYPWLDTLAHELVHLAVTRATVDAAPLWLQEGLAKNLEHLWRQPQPFDGHPAPDDVAAQAQRDGNSVGIDGLGNSIALLPTPEAAGIAYAEVQSFVGYLRAQQGSAGLHLLLRDLAVLGGQRADEALLLATGYDEAGWNVLWRAWLATRAAPDAQAEPHEEVEEETLRRARLGVLLERGGQHEPAAEELEAALSQSPAQPELRWRAARSWFRAGREGRALAALGTEETLAGLHGGWFALQARLLEHKDPLRAERARSLAHRLNPLLPELVCGDSSTPGGSPLAWGTDRTACQQALELSGD